MKRIISVIALFAFLVLGLAGCSSGQSTSTIDSIEEGAGGDLSIWSFSETTKVAADLFEAWYSDTYDSDVNVEVTIVPYDDFVGKLLPALQNGTGPDLFFMEIGHIGQFMAKGTDLVENLSQAPYNADELLANNVGYTTDVATGEDGNIYGITASAAPMGIFYRQDIADLIGYSEDDVVEAYTTADGTLQLCQDLADAGYYCFSDADDVEYMYDFYKIRPVDDETTTLSEDYLNAVSEYYLAMKEYFEAGYVSPYIFETTEWQQQLHIADPEKAQVFAINNGTWAMNKYLTEGEEEAGNDSTYGDWRFANGPTSSFSGGSWYYMSSSSEHKSLAWEFLEYYAGSDDYAAEYSKTNTDFYASYDRQEKFHDQQTVGFLGDENLYDIVGNALDEVSIEGYTSQYDSICDKAVIQILTDVEAGNIAEEDAMDELIAQIQTAAPEVQVPESYQ